MKCANGHNKNPQLFAPSERRKAENGKRAFCMACQKKARKEASPPRQGKAEERKRGSAWRKGGHDRIHLDGTKF